MQYFDTPCATIPPTELPPVGVGVKIDRNRTSPARPSDSNYSRNSNLATYWGVTAGISASAAGTCGPPEVRIYRGFLGILTEISVGHVAEVLPSPLRGLLNARLMVAKRPFIDAVAFGFARGSHTSQQGHDLKECIPLKDTIREN